MSQGTVEIPIEIWEHCQQDAERIAYLHKECIKLQVENERITEAWVDKKMQEDRDFLFQQNKRLLKAGDALAGIIANDLNCEGPYTPSAMQSIYLAWQAAKEVRDAK
jgi:hypothetical protein